MILYTCCKCNSNLKIEENDHEPGSCVMAGVYCPNCKNFVTKVFTSGIPEAYIIHEQDF